MYWYTNAPEVYDYGYVQTLHTFEHNNKTWRYIHVYDPERFRNYQLPRYSSGLHQAVEVGSKESENWDLPSDEEIRKAMLIKEVMTS